MLRGHVDAIERNFVVGWAADDQQVSVPVSVFIFVNGQRYARVLCDLNRADLVKDEWLGTASHGFRVVFDPPLPSRLELRISVRFAATGAIVPNGERVLPSDIDNVQLKPILITAPGRSGTTMFMEYLSRSDEVVIVPSHPYEVRMLTYYAYAYHVLTAPANAARSTNPDRLEGDGFFVGSNPFSNEMFNSAFKTDGLPREFFTGYVPDQLMTTFKQIILEYYLRHRGDQGKHGAMKFAEKNNNLDAKPREFAQAVFGEKKEVVLIREPRDLYCSRRAYFKQDARTAMQQTLWGCTQLWKLHQQKSPDAIFVRYEDIVLGDPGELRRVSDFLGVELHAADTSQYAGSKFLRHATSQSPLSSIARWRQDVAADEIQTIGESCQQFLELFGYDRDSGELAPASSVGALLPRPGVPVEIVPPADIGTHMQRPLPGTASVTMRRLSEGVANTAAPAQPGRFSFIRRISE
jgi:hypothetical protein